MSKGRDRELGRAYSDGFEAGYVMGRNDGYDYAVMIVQRLHKPEQYKLANATVCFPCTKAVMTLEDPLVYVPYPCPTIKALDGEQG